MIEDSAQSDVRGRGDVELYDFGRSTTLSREHARILELAFETFSRQWGAQLSARIRGRAQVSIETVTMQTYDEYARSLPPATTLAVCALPDSDDRIVIQFPASLATAWIVQMVGGRPGGTTEGRALTHIEQALVGALMKDALEHLTNAMSGLLPTGITVAGIQHSSQFTQVAGPNDPVIIGRLTVTSGAEAVAASVMLPGSVVLAAIGHRGAASAPPASPAIIRDQVERTPVELTLQLSPRSVRPHEVLELSVGDVLTFPHAADRPLALMVGDHPVATAAVGTSGARLACVVTATTAAPAPAQEIP